MLALAAQILESKVADFDPHAFRDRYEEALLAHLKAEQVGTVQERNPTFATPRRVINLMDALRRSVSEDKRQPRRAGEPRALQRANRRECHAAMPTALAVAFRPEASPSPQCFRQPAIGPRCHAKRCRPCHANARWRRLGRGHQCACCPLPSRSKPQPPMLQATRDRSSMSR